jgi:hypothetical protein
MAGTSGVYRNGPCADDPGESNSPLLVELLREYSNMTDTLKLIRTLRSHLDVPTPSGAAVTTRSTRSGHRHRLSQRLGDDVLDQIVEGYRAGQTSRQLADQFGVGKTAVLRLVRARITVRPRGPRAG